MGRETHNRIGEPKFRKARQAHQLIEKRRKGPSGVVYAVYGSRPRISSDDEAVLESRDRAYVVRHPGQVSVGGHQRNAEQGDIFILPCPTAKPRTYPIPEAPSRINGWALFAVLLVLATLIHLFLPIF